MAIFNYSASIWALRSGISRSYRSAVRSSLMPMHRPQARHLMTNCAASPSLYKNSLVRRLTFTLPASSRRALHSGHRSFGPTLSALYTFPISPRSVKKLPPGVCADTLGATSCFGVCLILFISLSFIVCDPRMRENGRHPCRVGQTAGKQIQARQIVLYIIYH